VWSWSLIGYLGGVLIGGLVRTERLVAASPLLSVVLCTFNRADRVAHTLGAVLAQEGVDVEVVVVDDGSTDATPATLAEMAGRDPRVRPVHQANAGLSAARNTGLAAATGAWVVFLDDDDVPDPGWLAALARPMGDPGVGITCCGSIFVGPDGEVIRPMPIIELPEPFGGVRAAYRAGQFAVRTELCRRAGGYLNGLGICHQYELFMRLQDEAQRRGLRIESTDANLLRIERRPAGDRRSSNPHIIYDATTWVLERHPERFARAAGEAAGFDGVRANAAARMEDWPTARRHFWSSARREPRHWRHWPRLMIALVPPLGRRVWGRHGPSAYPRSTVGVPVQTSDEPAVERELFLAWGYQENPGPALDAPSAGTATPPTDPALDRLVDRIRRRMPDLRSDHLLSGLEQDPDPVARLLQIARATEGAPALLTITDRGLSDGDQPCGPPSNPGHRREWTHDQFRLLLRSTGFHIERTWRHGTRRLLLVRTMDETPTRIN
jgi:glycosyltransferase involved in cell wall biosynthesis